MDIYNYKDEDRDRDRDRNKYYICLYAYVCL